MSSNSLSILTDILPANVTPSDAEYLQGLSAKPLAELLSTPSTLTSHATTLSSSLSNLVQSSYPSFLTIHTSTKAVSTNLDGMSINLVSLLDKSLPALDNAARDFRGKIADSVSERAKARAVLDQKDKLSALLEVPQLLETGIRSGMYDAALSLSSHVLASLPSERAPQNALALSLRAAVESAHASLRTTLLLTLSTPSARLPALHKAVTFLRRMDVLTEVQLALAFLQGRKQCIINALDLVSRESSTDDGDDLARFLKKYIESWREGVSDLIAQYTAIFLSSNSPKESPLSGPTPSSLLPPCLYELLHGHLLPQLEARLPNIPSHSLQTLLTQLSYLAAALSRSGLAFHPLLGPLFAQAVLQQTTKALQTAGALWKREIVQLALLPKSNVTSTDIVPSYDDSAPPHVAPLALSTPPSLARFTNALLNALNDLRSLAPIELKSKLLVVLDEILVEGLQDLNSTNASDTVAKKYVTTLVPFIRRALIEGVYGESSDVRESWSVAADSELGMLMSGLDEHADT